MKYTISGIPLYGLNDKLPSTLDIKTENVNIHILINVVGFTHAADILNNNKLSYKVFKTARRCVLLIKEERIATRKTSKGKNEVLTRIIKNWTRHCRKHWI